MDDFKPEAFVVGEWVKFYRGEECRKVQVTEVNDREVTARVFGQPMVFTPRPFDGKYVRFGSNDFEVMPDMIVRPKPSPVKKQSRLKDIRDFLHGMFWGSGL